MKTMHPVVANSNLGLPGNDSRHNKPDPNRGGGPTIRTRRPVPPANRGGFGHDGRRPGPGSISGTPKPTASNPASRGGDPHSMRPDTRNPNSGGGVQVRPGRDMRRQFGKSGQVGVPSYRHSQPQPSAGNTGGRSFRRISGHFTNKTKGAGGNTGKYGGPPVRLDH